MNRQQAVKLLLSDARGIYIPRDFAELFGEFISEEQIKVLKDPDHEWYWETWQDVLDNTTLELDGVEYSLHQDGDLWAYKPELMSLEEQYNFFQQVIHTPKGVVEMTIPQWLLVPLLYGDLDGLSTEEEATYLDFVASYGDEVIDHYDIGFTTYFHIGTLAGEGVLVWIKER